MFKNFVLACIFENKYCNEMPNPYISIKFIDFSNHV